MKRLLVLLAMAIAVPASANVASNPGFLGIRMLNASAAAPAGPFDGCLVTSVTPASAAEAAGLRADDVIVGLDGKTIGVCVDLTSAMQEYSPGTVVHLALTRGGKRETIAATLSSRAEQLHRRFVDRRLVNAHAVDTGDGTVRDLGQPGKNTTVLAWFKPGSCGNCAHAVEQVSDMLHARTGASSVDLVALAPGVASEYVANHVEVGAPLFVVDEALFDSASAGDDRERVYLMVVDHRGIVRFITPLAPADDAIDATIDELVAAVEQCEHARGHR